MVWVLTNKERVDAVHDTSTRAGTWEACVVRARPSTKEEAQPYYLHDIRRTAPRAQNISARCHTQSVARVYNLGGVRSTLDPERGDGKREIGQVIRGSV